MTRHPHRVFAVTAILLGTLAAGTAHAATWKTNVNYGANTGMDLYVPDKVAASPAVVVSLHYCGGTAVNAHGWFQSYADQYGFIIIAPQAGGSCFDAALGRTGERANITKMVQYVVMQNNADAKRVYAAGASSGGCMSEALIATYPDVFAAGSALAGVPAGAWTGGNAYGWTTPAGTTAQQWGDKVRQADPGFSGSWPRFQLWQGMGDTTLTYAQNYPAQVAQWTNVYGVTDANATKESVKPAGATDTWARSSYKNAGGTIVFEANNAPNNVPHDLTGRGLWADVVRFFGLNMTSGGGSGGAGGGSAGTGGRAGTGGAVGSGGTTNTGGAPGSGSGGSSSGGAPGSGGASNSGGSGGNNAGSGGQVGSGGSPGSGGAVISSGGAPASSGGQVGSGGRSVTGSGGNTSTVDAGGSATGADADTGCACGMGGRRNQSAAGALVVLALAGLRLTRRRRSR